jgi:hypothetical protein
VRGAVPGFYLNHVGCVFFFVLGVFLTLLVGCEGGEEVLCRECLQMERGVNAPTKYPS